MDSPLVDQGATIAGRLSALGLLSPSPVYLKGEESLQLTGLGNAAGVTLTLVARVMSPDGELHVSPQVLAPTSNRVAASAVLRLSEGWLLGFEVKATAGAPAARAVWALVELVRGPSANIQAVQALAYDFVTANNPLLWPGGLNADPVDGPGCLRAIVGTQPGAGAELSEVVPSGARWELLAFEADLATSAVAANRVPQLTIDDGANIYSRFSVNTNETASQTWKNSFQQGVTLSADATRFVITAPLPSNIKLGPGHRIRTVTAAIDVGDQWQAPKYLVLERFDV